MKQFVILILGIAVFVGAWVFISPLFIDEKVDESFDFVLDDGRVDMPQVMAMPVDKREAMKSDIMAAAANAPDAVAADDMPAQTPRAIARGEFVDADAIHKGSGTATVYELPDGTHVVRFEDFRATNGPALVVYLSEHAAPMAASDISAAGFVSLGKLKGNVGNQNYVVPASVDIDAFNSVAIWCELFDVLFSPAALTRIGDD